MRKAATIKSELTWSFSRDRMFKECRRAYYYNYYASWLGWLEDADEFARKAYILKNIRSIDVWIGDVVHQIIKWIFENKINAKDISYKDALHKAKQLLLSTWEQSRQHMWKRNVKYNLNLFEHYYNCEPSREELVPKLQKVTRSIHNIYNSGLLQWVASLPRNSVLRVDEVDSFDFEGVKIFAVPDFAVKDNNYILYDWKTGRPSDKDVLQLSCYTLYAVYKWGISADKVRLIPVYLTEEPLSMQEIVPLDIQTVEQYIRDSIAEMKAVLIDVAKNQPDIERCYKTDDYHKCRRCRFQEICQ
jgi:hypothetical protein